MDKDKLLKLIDTLIVVKEKVKCPICLDFVKDSVELSCGHRYCNNCLNEHKSHGKNSSCPLCKRAITKRSAVYKDHYADELGEFVSHVNNLFKKNYGCGVGWLNKNKDKIDVLIGEANVTPKKTLVTKRNSRKLELNTGPSKPKCEDAFQKLLNLPKHTYIHKVKQNSDQEYSLHQFYNEENRQRILNWLNNNKFTFEKLTQSQEIKQLEENVDIDIPSVSQVSSKFPRRKVKRIRSQSADANKKQNTKKPALKRYKSTGNESKDEDYVIEEIDSEQILQQAQNKVIQDLLEDECVENYDNLTLNKMDNIINQKRNRNSPHSSDTDWNRLETVNKTLRKSRKSPKQLNITLQSKNGKSVVNTRNSNNKKKTRAAEAKHSPDLQDDKSNNVLKIEETETKDVSMKRKSEVNNKSYDLNMVEKYFSIKMTEQNIESSTDNKHLEHTASNELTRNVKKINNCDDIFLLPTRETDEDCKTNNYEVPVFPAVSEDCVHLVDIVNTLGENLHKCKTNSSGLFEEMFNNLESYVKRLRSVLGNKSSKEVQTIIYSEEASVQTDLVEKHDKDTQITVNKEENNVQKSLLLDHSQNDVAKLSQTKITQESLRNFAAETDSQRFDNKANMNIDLITKADKSQSKCSSSVLVCSVELSGNNRRINRKLNFNEPLHQQRFKRLRPPASDSDSDEEKENGHADKRQCNRFIRDDLTIQFTETQKKTPEKVKECSLKLTSDSENLDYDKYLEEVMKKYDTPKNSPEKEETDLRSTEDDELQKMCDNLIENIRKRDSEENNPKITSLKSHEKLSFEGKELVKKTPVFSNDDEFQELCDQLVEQIRTEDHEQENISQKNELKCLNKTNLEKYEESKNHSDIKEKPNITDYDIIENTESLYHLAKRPKQCLKVENHFSESLFGNDTSIKQLKNDYIEEKNDQNDFDDDLDAEMEKIAFTAMQVQNEDQKTQPKINILHNIKIKSADHFNYEKIIISDSEDENLLSDGNDVVETTPQKSHRAKDIDSILKQVPSNTNCVNIISSSEELELDVFLPPPPGFEDNTEKQTILEYIQDDVTLKKDRLSLTPDRLSQLLPTPKSSSSDKENCAISSPQHFNQSSATPNTKKTMNLLHSTPHTQRSTDYSILPLSPINKDKSNLMQITQSSRYTPLVTNKLATKKQNIMTSMPNQKSILNFVMASQESNYKPSQRPKPCIACTRVLSKDHLFLSRLENKKLVTLSSTFGPEVTHMIVSVNDKNCVKAHTAKYVLAVAAGIWVLNMEWVQECLSQNQIVPEEKYEVLDVSGVAGPKISRLSRKINPLFKGFKFYCAPPFANVSQKDVKDIIEMLGGEVVSDPKEFMRSRGFVNLTITDPNATVDTDKFEHWLERYKAVTVDVEWLTRSVGQYKVLSVRPYILCSDDSICELGYPSHLVEVVPYTCSEYI